MRIIEAVVDGDLLAALLARRLGADLLLLSSAGAPGSLTTKEEAAHRFVESTGRRAVIGTVAQAEQIVRDVELGDRVTLARDGSFQGG